MPYVPQDIRDELESREPANVGELTYALYDVLVNYPHNRSDGMYLDLLDLCTAYLYAKGGAPNFARHAEVLGAITSARIELVRHGVRIGDRLSIMFEVLNAFYLDHTAPYEDRKREQNGEVYARTANL